MPTSLRLLLIGLAGPAVAHLVSIVVLFAPLLIFTAVVSYSIAVVVTAIALVSLHGVFVRRKYDARRQLTPILLVSSVCGLMVYVVLAWPHPFSLALAAWYAAFGVVNGLSCWALYNWGPLRVSRSNFSSSGRDVSATGADVRRST
jgi:O-antigen/teichoic acid export membrane protein